MGLLFTYLIVCKVHIFKVQIFWTKKNRKPFVWCWEAKKQQQKQNMLSFSTHVIFLPTISKLDRSILSVPVCACVPNLDLYNGNTISEINSNIFAIGVVGKQLPSQSKVVIMCSEFLSCEISHVTQGTKKGQCKF